MPPPCFAAWTEGSVVRHCRVFSCSRPREWAIMTGIASVEKCFASLDHYRSKFHGNEADVETYSCREQDQADVETYSCREQDQADVETYSC